MKRYLIEGSNDGGLFAETVDAMSQEEAEALAVSRLCEAWGHDESPDTTLDDLGDCASVREYGPDDYMRDAAEEMLAALILGADALTPANNDEEREALDAMNKAIAAAEGRGLSVEPLHEAAALVRDGLALLEAVEHVEDIAIEDGTLGVMANGRAFRVRIEMLGGEG